MSVLTPQLSTHNILREIDAENGLELLTSFQEDFNPFGDSSYIDTLDVLFSRKEGILRPNKTTEIQGPPKSGKSSLILFLSMTILLPYSILLPFGSSIEEKEVIVGGKGPNLIILCFDPSSKFQVDKLKRMLRDHLDKRINDFVRVQELSSEDSPKEKTRDEIVTHWLKSLLIWRPKEESGFIASVKLARAEAAKRSSNGKISLIIIPALSAFYPASRLRYESLSSTLTSTSSAISSPSLSRPFSILLSSIKQLQNSTTSPIIYSNWESGSALRENDLRIPFKSSTTSSESRESKIFSKDYQITLDPRPTQAPEIKKTASLRESMISQRVWENEVESGSQGVELIGIPKLRWIEGWLQTSAEEDQEAQSRISRDRKNHVEGGKSKGLFCFSVQSDSVTPRPL